MAAEKAAAEKEAAEKEAAARAAEEEAADKAAAEKAAADEAAAAEQRAAAELAWASTATKGSEEADGSAAAAAAPAANDAEQGAAAAQPTRRVRCAAPTAGALAPTRLEVVQEGDDVVVRLHATEIVRLRSRGELTLSSGGWRTVSRQSEQRRAVAPRAREQGASRAEGAAICSR